jgi:D-proline reductase (dithiol) PrdB
MTDPRVTVDYIPRTRELYSELPPYRWADHRTDPVPWTPLTKPLASCRVALGSTGGVYAPGQPPFHFKDDTSVRVIPTSLPANELRVSHFGYPTGDAERDPNCVFPVDRLRELVADGTVGELAATAITCMGGIYSQRRVREELIPAVLEWLIPLDVDLFYLVPA